MNFDCRYLIKIKAFLSSFWKSAVIRFYCRSDNEFFRKKKYNVKVTREIVFCFVGNFQQEFFFFFFCRRKILKRGMKNQNFSFSNRTKLFCIKWYLPCSQNRVLCLNFSHFVSGLEIGFFTNLTRFAYSGTEKYTFIENF